ASALFGGICVTGTIARTATNIRAGARTPVSGILHALFLLVFMAVAAPLAGYVPLSALAGVLVVVAWNMVEKDEFARLLRDWRSASVLLATFGVTILKDLTFGIGAGCLLALVLWTLHKPVAEEGQ
ncbi:MAG TPA: SulP family inorganic anion transporter, partial [Caulobacteraceae bacterium]|nr:SulP family inorganic anion transporter [Caulobacteraceae bacterium]